MSRPTPHGCGCDSRGSATEWIKLPKPACSATRKASIYLAFTETWERFSYYGMTALLTLYMVQQLFLPGHAEHVVGLAALRHVFEWRGPISDVAFASLIYGWYGGLVYFTPIWAG